LNFNKKVFHGILNYGTQAGFISKGLREIGIQTLSVSKKDKYKRHIDIELKAGGNYLQRKSKQLSNAIFLIRCFLKYDIFHFYSGRTLLWGQIDLYFYRLFRKKVVMHYLGNDVELYEWSVKNYEITNMQEMMSPEEGKIHDEKIRKRREFEDKFIDKSVVCAPQYSPFVENTDFIPLALDLGKFEYTPLPKMKNEVLRVLHAPTNRKKKGTSHLLAAIERLKKENYKIELDLCENITHAELIRRYKHCHVSVVALLGGWYGTAGIEAMAIGRPIITFLRPSLFKYTDLKEEEIPIISAHKNSIYTKLKEILDGKYNLQDLSLKSREFVLETHDYKKISKRFLEIYKQLY
jgi:glycosyltransferase involved in cell wall biosynthesis